MRSLNFSWSLIWNQVDFISNPLNAQMKSTVKSIMKSTLKSALQSSKILLDFMKSFEISEFHEILLLLVNCIGFYEIHYEIWQISHEIHIKSVKTTNSSEISHFLLVFHVESGGFHIKSIKCPNEIHNEIHIEICIVIQ